MTLPDLDALIAEVDQTCATTDWAARLVTAADISVRLAALGDDLVTEFVEQARFAGQTWAEVGAVLGISRQAAQQRFYRPFATYETERFSGELEQAMASIKREAVQRRHNYIGTEHVLLGLLAEPNTATALLESVGVDVAQVRRAVARHLPLGASQAAARIPWTPYARKILTLAAESAGERGGSRIECRHVLIAILRLGRGRAADALGRAGVNMAAVAPESAGRR